MLHDGRHKDKYRADKIDVAVLACKINDEPVIVTRREVASYINDPFFIYILGVYNYTKLWGLPNGRGWANEPVDILEGITALELEARAIEHEELDNAKHKGTGSNNAQGGRGREGSRPTPKRTASH